MQLVNGATYADCEEQNIPLEPCDLCGRVLEADTWFRHLDSFV